MFLVATSTSAKAQSRPGKVELSFLVDGGALPFVWFPLIAGRLNRRARPAEKPWLFSDSEGAQPRKSETVPSAYVGAATAMTMLGLIVYPDDGRWFHLKGFLQSTSVSILTVGILKNGFGRHRPSFDSNAPLDAERKSFPSGHATSAFRLTTYTALYLRYHVFDKLRGDDRISWPEIPAYAALTALAAFVPYTRVRDNRHHVTDVIAGGALGFTSSFLFFHYQERRLGKSRRKSDRASLSVWNGGHGLSMGWEY